jgi:hypothetical protein
MENFWLYFRMGLHHVLDIGAYDHVLFFIALMIPYSFKEWKTVFTLITVFTFGHTLSLILAVYNILKMPSDIVEFLIPITIFLTALYYLITAGKTKAKNNINFELFVTLFFGLIHGLGFSNYFKTVMVGTSEDKLLPLLEFALGIEIAQIAVVLVVLVIGYVVQHFFRTSKRDWALILAAFVMGVVTPMIIESEFWNK